MSNQIKHWDDIFKNYESSGLSQIAFCKVNDLSFNQFHYQKKRMEARVAAQKITAPRKTLINAFETINFAMAPATLNNKTNIIELGILLPNKIRCSVKINLCELPVLLKQMAVLC